MSYTAVVRRIAFHICAVLALALAAFTAVLLYRSYTTCDSLSAGSVVLANQSETYTWLEIHSFPGCLGFNVGRRTGNPTGLAAYVKPSLVQSRPKALVSRYVGPESSFVWRHGFGWHVHAPSAAEDHHHASIHLPHWLLILVFLLAPGRWVHLHFSRWKGERRARKQGLCLVCAYDLRAHKPGERCPECGTVIPQTPTDPRTSGP